jgi:hypothetical protein
MARRSPVGAKDSFPLVSCHRNWKVELFFRWIKQHLRIKAFNHRRQGRSSSGLTEETIST